MNKFSELAARIMLAAIFLTAGLNKIGHYDTTAAYMDSQGVSSLLLPAVIALEIIAPLLLIIGWQTRYAALLLAGFTLTAAALFHANFADPMQSILFMKNLAIAGGLLILFTSGAGRFSLDARSKPTPA